MFGYIGNPTCRSVTKTKDSMDEKQFNDPTAQLSHESYVSTISLHFLWQLIADSSVYN